MSSHLQIGHRCCFMTTCLEHLSQMIFCHIALSIHDTSCIGQSHAIALGVLFWQDWEVVGLVAVVFSLVLYQVSFNFRTATHYLCTYACIFACAQQFVRLLNCGHVHKQDCSSYMLLSSGCTYAVPATRLTASVRKAGLLLLFTAAGPSLFVHIWLNLFISLSCKSV